MAVKLAGWLAMNGQDGCLSNLLKVTFKNIARFEEYHIAYIKLHTLTN